MVTAHKFSASTGNSFYDEPPPLQQRGKFYTPDGSYFPIISGLKHHQSPPLFYYSANLRSCCRQAALTEIGGIRASIEVPRLLEDAGEIPKDGGRRIYAEPTTTAGFRTLLPSLYILLNISVGDCGRQRE
jgi:hypothetical protein